MIGDFVDTDVAKKNSIKMANERGLPCCGMETIYNSKPAQELSAWAGLKNRGMAFRKAVFHACYGEGRNISDIGVLKEIAEAIELDPAEAEQVLKNRVYKDIVDHDWLRKNELALVAAPTYFIKGDRLVGCHPYEKMKNFSAPLFLRTQPQNFGFYSTKKAGEYFVPEKMRFFRMK